jgi:enamine deaminase RidA (YjgF/YER057c/UK114 family)
MNQRKITDMKFRLAVIASLLPLVAHAEEGDKQSIYQISGTTPIIVSGSTRVGPLSDQTRAVRIAPKVDAHCKFGGSGVAATVSDTIFFAYTAEYVKIQPTGGTYLACIQDTSTGTVYVDEMKP